MNEFYLYRALPDKDITMAVNLKADLLSEAMSRVMESSELNNLPYFLCWTEDPRIAYRYSKKLGYSGKVARIKVRVCEDGTLEVVGNKTAVIYRTWHMQDWLFLAKKSNWPNVATNVNYKCPQTTMASIITYQGRKAPRAYAHSDKSFIVHAITLNYDVLSTEEALELSQIKIYRLKSYKLLQYDFSDVISQNNIRTLISAFKTRDNGKAHNRIMIEQLEGLLIA